MMVVLCFLFLLGGGGWGGFRGKKKVYTDVYYTFKLFLVTI